MKREEPKGLTSVEAAALLLSGGETKDPDKAVIIDQHRGQVLQMEELIKANLRRQMGFDFKIKIEYPTLFVRAKDGSNLSTRATLTYEDMDEGGHISQSLIDKLVDCCVRLKEEWDIRHDSRTV